MDKCGFILVLVACSVQGFKVGGRECGGGSSSVFNDGAGGSSHHRAGGHAPEDELCGVSSCCSNGLVPYALRDTGLLLSWFNNTVKYESFRSKVSSHVEYVRAHSDTSPLWDATASGLTVLRDQGVKFWNSQFLTSDVLSRECSAKIVQAAACGGCVANRPVDPCKTLCQNVVMGCLKSPFAEIVEEPWKQAVSAVRTAVRLITTRNSSLENVVKATLTELVSDLNGWREPISWWLGEGQQHICSSLPDTECWNGRGVGVYSQSAASWRSPDNPEFSSRSSNSSSSRVVLVLRAFSSDLDAMRRTLEAFWPQTGSDPHPRALPLSSTEDTMFHEGSGEYDDEDLEYNSSGYGGIPSIESDDEDLPAFEGSGSGDSDLDPLDLHGGRNRSSSGIPTDKTPPDRPPVKISGAATPSFSWLLVTAVFAHALKLLTHDNF